MRLPTCQNIRPDLANHPGCISSSSTGHPFSFILSFDLRLVNGNRPPLANAYLVHILPSLVLGTLDPITVFV